jgi:hypothetical protein
MRRFLVASLATPVLAVALAAGAPVATAASERILDAEQHSSDKARRLARTYAPALATLDAGVYHCLPWVEVQARSIGFFKPKHATQDDRYLAIRVYVEQDASPAFASLPVESRAASMYSRYVGPLLRRMTREAALLRDPDVGGFAIVLEWRKQGAARDDGRTVHEAIVAYLTRPDVAEYVAGRLAARELAGRARILGFDGDRPLGTLRLAAWDDDFVATHKVANYQLAPGVSCP